MDKEYTTGSERHNFSRGIFRGGALSVNNSQIMEKRYNFYRVDRKTESTNSAWHWSSRIVNRFLRVSKWQLDTFVLRRFLRTESKSKSISNEQILTRGRKFSSRCIAKTGWFYEHSATCMASAGKLFPRCCQAKVSVSKTVMTDVDLPFPVLFPQEIWVNS